MAIRNMLPDFWRGEHRTWSPVREMNRLQRRLDHVFDDLLGEPFRARELMPFADEEFLPACDVEETKSHYIVNFDLPGVKREDVKIDLQGSHLTVSGERRFEQKAESGRFNRERYYGAFSRSFMLPQNIDPEKVEANYENGVLQIVFPKTEQSTGKQIPIKEGKLLTGTKGKAA